MQAPSRVRFGLGVIDGYTSDAAYQAAVAAPVQVGDFYFNTTLNCYRVCYTLTPSPTFNGSNLPVGTVNGSILVWSSGSSQYVEDASILIAGNVITSPLSAIVLNVPTIQGLDQVLATNTTIRAGNSSGASNNGGNLTLSAGAGGVSGFSGQVSLSGSLINLGAVSSTDPAGGIPTSIYYNTVSNVFRYYNGSAWANIGQGGIAQVTYWDITSTTLPTSAPYSPDGTAVATGDTVLFTALSGGNNEVYRATVSGPSVAWTVVAIGQNPSGAPTVGDSAYVDFGTARHDSLLFYNGSTSMWTTTGGSGANTFLSNLTSPTAINQSLLPGSNFGYNLGSPSFGWGTLYVAGISTQGTASIIENYIPIQTATLADNQTSPVVAFSDSNTGNSSMIVEYSILRGSGGSLTRETGLLRIANDGTNIQIDRSFVASNGPAGITFTVAAVGPIIVVYYTSTPTGFSGTFRWSVREWT